ncbi:MAG: hypothetical protein ACYS9Y_04565 [Planctomycetota bacterium]|jgi:hypothetical protein
MSIENMSNKGRSEVTALPFDGDQRGFEKITLSSIQTRKTAKR